MLLLGLSQVWGWIGLGLALIAIEVLMAPGSYLLWLGIAALLTGVYALLASPGPLHELAIFGLLAIASAVLGWKMYHPRKSGPDAADGLHDLAADLIGREVVLASAIREGHGQARIADSVWRVSGPNLPEGARVRIIGRDGPLLTVEAA
jgi:membrane protein implicated in regulation of membrane protease activity